MAQMAGGNPNVHGGTFTLDTATGNEIDIAHGFDHAPSFFMVACLSSDSSNHRRYCSRSSNKNCSMGIYGSKACAGSLNNLSSNDTAYAYTDNINIIMIGNSTPWAAGDYIWFAYD